MTDWLERVAHSFKYSVSNAEYSSMWSITLPLLCRFLSTVLIPQAQQGIQRKAFSTLDEIVEYYKQGKRGIVCALTVPMPQKREEEPEQEVVSDESGKNSSSVCTIMPVRTTYTVFSKVSSWAQLFCQHNCYQLSVAFPLLEDHNTLYNTISGSVVW